MRQKKKDGPEQLELAFPEASATPVIALRAVAAPPTAQPAAPLAELPRPRPGLRVIQGGGERVQEPLGSRDAVVRVLIEAGADLLLRRISPERAEHIEGRVSKILALFDRVDATPALMPALRRELDDLEALMRETRAHRGRPVPASAAHADR